MMTTAKTTAVTSPPSGQRARVSGGVPACPHLLDALSGMIGDRAARSPSLLTPDKDKKRERAPWPHWLIGKRRHIETVLGQLVERYRVKRLDAGGQGTVLVVNGDLHHQAKILEVGYHRRVLRSVAGWRQHPTPTPVEGTLFNEHMTRIATGKRTPGPPDRPVSGHLAPFHWP